MARTYFPEHHILVPASAPHPPNTEYKVSIGNEQWSDTFIRVVKVQMVYDGKVSGRRSPSYPVDSNDLALVQDAITEVQKKNEQYPKISVRELCKLTSIDGLKIFEIIKSWSDRSEIIITLDDLYQILNISKSLQKDFSRFSKTVLETAHNDIHQNTSLRFNWKPINVGSKVTAIRFEVIKDTDKKNS